MPSGVKLPSVEQVLELAAHFGMAMTAGEAETYRALMQGPANAYRRVEEMSQLRLPEPGYPRTPGYRPEAAENPYNGWYYKTDIAGADTGLLKGHAVAVKDAICVAGVPMMAGSRILQGFVPNIDATVVTRLLDAGATIAGKANCEDMSFSGSGHTCASGAVRNPHKPSHSPGGSSNGSAVVIAAGDVDLALGGDQGGSIRIPAAWCGVVGLKPSYGLVPYTGAMTMEMTLDHIGPMARNVEGTARLLSVLAGQDPTDPRQRGVIPAEPERDYLSAIGQGVAGARIAVLREGFDVAPRDDMGLPGSEAVVDAKVKAAVKALEKRGATVTEVSIPMHLDGVSIWLAIHLEGPAAIINSGGMGSNWAGLYNTSLYQAMARGMRAHIDDLSHTVKTVLLLSEHMQRHYHGMYYAMGQNLRGALRQAYDEVLASYDVLVMPTVPFRATPLPDEDCSIEDYVAFGLNMVHNTGQFDVTGHPAISVPCGMADGLPIGMMIVGRHFDDKTVLRIADAFEKIGDWQQM